MNKVRIVVPLYKTNLDAFEQISLLQALKIFNDKTFVFVIPEGLDTHVYRALCVTHQINCEIESFDSNSFESVASYNKLLLTLSFYKRFEKYEFILIYQLDSFVFKDELLYWCEKDYDYIGSPWFESFGQNVKSTNLWGVGNGGFSLRKVSTAIRILSEGCTISKSLQSFENDKGLSRLEPFIHTSIPFKEHYMLPSNLENFLDTFEENEDVFWGIICYVNLSGYKIPSTAIALRFGFEQKPEYLFALNNFSLPFGCHAWKKYNFNFWKIYISKFGYLILIVLCFYQYLMLLSSNGYIFKIESLW